jgi:hypothetical protein
MLAAMNRHEATVQLLLKNGAGYLE